MLTLANVLCEDHLHLICHIKFDKILICRTEKLYAIILNSRPIDAHLINKFFKVPGFLYIFSSLFTLNFDISDIWIPKKVEKWN